MEVFDGTDPTVNGDSRWQHKRGAT
jgi:hypothetical protein